MKCRVCRQPAVIEIRRHNAGFCQPCFCRHCREQVRRAIDDFDMIGPGRPGAGRRVGRQGLPGPVGPAPRPRATRPTGCTSGLGIGEYSDASGSYARDFAARREAQLVEIDLPGEFGFDIPTGAAGGPPGALLGVRAVQAASLQPGRPRRRLRRDRHRAQPRRRGGGAVRQRPALGHWPTSAASTRCCRPATASPARSSRWSAWASGRWRRTACCAASTTSSRSARWRSATGTSATRTPSTTSRCTSPGSKAAFYFGFVDRVSALVQPEAEDERDGLHPCPGCGVADHRRAVRLLQAGDQGDGRLAGERARRDRAAASEVPAARQPMVARGRPFAAGDRVLLFDTKGRRYLVHLGGRAASSTPTPDRSPTTT